MRIGEVAKHTGLNISSIRFYERKNLLSPKREDESSYRDYSEEDVCRIKKILLYRKMGISIETIYLLLNDQEIKEDVLKRQKENLQEQIDSLKGSIALCDLIINENNMDSNKIDDYLNYVYQEESKGVRFAKVSELLEDLADFTRDEVFYPNSIWMFKESWLVKIMSVCFWIFIIAVPVIHIIEVILGKEELRISFLLYYGVIIIICGYGFIKYRSMKKK